MSRHSSSRSINSTTGTPSPDKVSLAGHMHSRGSPSPNLSPERGEEPNEPPPPAQRAPAGGGRGGFPRSATCIGATLPLSCHARSCSDSRTTMRAITRAMGDRWNRRYVASLRTISPPSTGLSRLRSAKVSAARMRSLPTVRATRYDRCFAAFDGERIVGTIIGLPFDLAVPGQATLPVGGVTA